MTYRFEHLEDWLARHQAKNRINPLLLDYFAGLTVEQLTQRYGLSVEQAQRSVGVAVQELPPTIESILYKELFAHYRFTYEQFYLLTGEPLVIYRYLLLLTRQERPQKIASGRFQAFYTFAHDFLAQQQDRYSAEPYQISPGSYFKLLKDQLKHYKSVENIGPQVLSSAVPDETTTKLVLEPVPEQPLSAHDGLAKAVQSKVPWPPLIDQADVGLYLQDTEESVANFMARKGYQSFPGYYLAYQYHDLADYLLKQGHFRKEDLPWHSDELRQALADLEHGQQVIALGTTYVNTQELLSRYHLSRIVSFIAATLATYDVHEVFTAYSLIHDHRVLVPFDDHIVPTDVIVTTFLKWCKVIQHTEIQGIEIFAVQQEQLDITALLLQQLRAVKQLTLTDICHLLKIGYGLKLTPTLLKQECDLQAAVGFDYDDQQQLVMLSRDYQMI